MGVGVIVGVGEGGGVYSGLVGGGGRERGEEVVRWWRERGEKVVEVGEEEVVMEREGKMWLRWERKRWWRKEGERVVKVGEEEVVKEGELGGRNRIEK
ncbi:hypothetical protein Pmani_034069 [Petrolisthes manimaculis]|uniref:Uncharacterized protein n=1 Tax=Petrolisthes manimaculis TaxID=1843537 RepID=A0AAE1NNB4_9EUCA|nr:hypothetical protein Pmani_034069 [Petrolisthes manimaculis]